MAQHAITTVVTDLSQPSGLIIKPLIITMWNGAIPIEHAIIDPAEICKVTKTCVLLELWDETHTGLRALFEFALTFCLYSNQIKLIVVSTCYSWSV